MPAVKQEVPNVEPDMASAEEAMRRAGERVDEQRRRERDERERRRRLADRRAVLSDEALATLRQRAEEALAKDGVGRVHLGYKVLLKLKLDELLERESLQANVSASEGNPDTTVAGS
jgi:hypothetical protein